MEILHCQETIWNYRFVLIFILTIFSLWKLIKTTQMRKNNGYLFRAWNSKRVTYHHLLLTETQGPEEEFHNEDRRNCQYALNGRHREGEAGGSTTRSEVSYMIGLGVDLTLSGWSWVIKLGKNWEYGSHWLGPDSSGSSAAKIVDWFVRLLLQKL